MVIKFFKRLQVAIWEYSIRHLLIKKFKLYGSYKQIYSWKNYKYLKDHLALFKPLKYKINPEWYKYFTLVRQKENPAYLPEDVWHICLEPVLNNKSYAKAFNDKNLFDSKDFKDLFPKTYLHIIQSIFYCPDYRQLTLEQAQKQIPADQPFVVKKSIDSGGGKGVGFYEPGNNIPNLSEIIKKYGKNVVIQEKVKQNDWFARFNPDSINTIRVVTYRSVKDERVHVLQTLLRMGKQGSRVDNQSSGGIACGINESGKINNWGCDKVSNQFTSVNGLMFAELDPVPNFELLKATCKRIAASRIYERVLVFDTWQDNENNIRLTEINNVNIGIEDLQKNNGPMFGEFTQEVINWCATHPRTYCFDFELLK